MLEVDYNTKLYGVIGRKISYTLSPAIHNYSFSVMGVNAVYLAFDLEEDKVNKAVPGLLEVGAGFNVTIPYKEKVMEFLDKLDDTAEKVGAVNTIKGKVGYNTDYLALKEILSRYGYFDTLVFGAGGASRAIAVAVAEEGVNLYIYDRTREKGERLASYLREKGFKASYVDHCNLSYEIVVNATPDPSFPPDQCIKGKLAIDFVYTPVMTSFLTRAKEKGMATVDGLEILVGQALEAQKIWLGKSANKDEVVKYLYARKLVR